MEVKKVPIFNPIGKIMNIMCETCCKTFYMIDLYHLVSGSFLCKKCFEKDEALRLECNLPKNKLMINNKCLNKGEVNDR